MTDGWTHKLQTAILVTISSSPHMGFTKITKVLTNFAQKDICNLFKCGKNNPSNLIRL